jgi:hypothetical protein
MSSSASELPVLVGQSGPLNGQRWQMEGDLMIGRDPSCDIIINDRQVSRYHARIEINEKGIYLEDLGSKNGTFYNGHRVEDPVSLQDGDLVQIALVQHFQFFITDATMPLDTEALPVDKPRGNLYLELRSRRVWVKNQEIVPPLSLQQFRLLEALQRRNGQVVTRQELIDEIWGDEESEGVSEQAFDALVRRLRGRLASLDPHKDYIVTVRGHGLRLDNP